MPYIGNNHIAGDHTNNFKVLDDISSYTATFDGSATSVVDTTNNTIRVVEHRFIQGQRVTYTNGSGGNIGGLTTGTAYFVIFDSASTIKLATSASNAANSTAINLSAVGSGSSHTLNAAFDGVNTKFKLTHGSGTGARLNNATQINVAINNVLQRPNLDPNNFTDGFALEDNHKIVFQTAPTSEDIFWGSIIANTLTTFDISDHKIDTFTGDGSTTEFTLSHTPANNESLMVTINGVLQHPSNASTARAYTLIASIIQFTAAPGVGDEIQVRHLGFAGATTADVSGFYGRTGNVVLTSNDHITTGDITSRNINASGIITAASANFGGNVSIGGTLTYEDVTNIDSVGIITARSSIYVADSIIHEGDTDTKIDFLPNQIKLTAANRLRIDFQGNGYNRFYGTQHSEATSSYPKGTNATYVHRFRDTEGDDTEVQFFNTNVKNSILSWNDYGNSTSAGNLLFKGVVGGSGVEHARFTGSGNFNLLRDLDVDGHTNLDNVSIVGVTTTTDNIDIDADNKKLQIGASQDLQLFHDGGHSRITNTTGILKLTAPSGSSVRMVKPDDSGNVAVFHIDAETHLYYNGAHKFSTISDGIQVIGNATINDSIIHNGDTNTKIRFPAADTISLETGGHDRIYIKSDGFVGIGTDAPLNHLHLNSNGNNGVSFRMENYEGYSTLHNDSGALHFDSGFHLFRNMDGSSEFLRIDSSGRLLVGTTTEGHNNADDLTIATSGHTGITLRSGTSNNGSVFFSDGTSGADEYRGWVQYTHTSNYLTFGTNASERLRIDIAGRLSLGVTATGSYPVGSQARQVQAEIKGGISGNDYHHGSLALNCTNNNANLHLVRSDNNQNANVGLGNISFSGYDGSDFHVAAQISAIRDAAGGNNDVPGRLIFLTTADGASQPTERLRINSSGNVRIGGSADTTDQGYRLTLQGSSNATYLQFFDNGTGTTYGSDGSFVGLINQDFYVWNREAKAVVIGSSNNERLRIDSSGHVLIGKTSGDHILDINASSDEIRLTKASASDYNGIQLDRDASGNAGGYFGLAGNTNHYITGSAQHDICVRSESNLLFSSGGATESLRINSSGRLIINHRQTSTPLNDTFLSIYDANSDASAIRPSGVDKNYAMISLHNYGTGNNGNATGIGFGAGSSFSYTKGSIAFQRQGSYGTGDLVFLTNNDQDTTMVNDTDERMRIQRTGQVTIGDGNELASSYDANLLIDGGSGSQLTLIGSSSGWSKISFADGSGSTADKNAGFIYMQHSTTNNGPNLSLGLQDVNKVMIREPGSNRGQLEVYGNFNESTNPAIEINDNGDARKVFLTNSSGDFNALTRNGSQTKGQLKMFESGILTHNMKDPDSTNVLQTFRAQTYRNQTGSTNPSISPDQTWIQKGGGGTYDCFEESNMTLTVNGGGNDHYQPVAFVPRGYDLDTSSFGGQWAGEMWIHQTGSQNPENFGYSGYNNWATMSFKCKWDSAHWNAKPNGFWVEHYINYGRAQIGKIDNSGTMSQFVIYLLPGFYHIRCNCVRGMAVHRSSSNGGSITLRDGGSMRTYSTLAYSSRNTSFDSEISPGSANNAHTT